MTPQKRLRESLGNGGIVLAPGVYDALGAMLAARAGFEAIYLSGASIAYTMLARPDIGYLGADEVAKIVGHIRERTDLPLIADADTGFGNALNVQRTVQVYERAGASAIQIEDQAMPKRCGHLAGKQLVSKGEMVGKVKAAIDSRRDPDTLIIARTDAVAVEGIKPALERARDYAEAGADILFVEAPRDDDELRGVVKELRHVAPLMANMVEGGRTPMRPADALADIGYSLVIFPGGLVRALARAGEAYFASLREHGSTAPYVENMFDFDQLNGLLGTPAILAAGKTYDEDAQE